MEALILLVPSQLVGSGWGPAPAWSSPAPLQLLGSYLEKVALDIHTEAFVHPRTTYKPFCIVCIRVKHLCGPAGEAAFVLAQRPAQGKPA